MAMNFYGAIWAFSVNFIVAVAISMMGRPKPEKELVGLVYSLTPKPVEHEMKWYERPTTIAYGLIIMLVALNIIFR
jgi:solute:Na+ symporter, SSS family